MTNIRTGSLAIIVAAMTLVSCTQKPQITEPAVVESETRSVDSIQWFDGTVDEAFAVAKAQGKPIYLYWGAEWCPPCHAIKATVFSSPEFIARSHLFVAVYIDGDSENAQAEGEKFGLLGYPTMIIFDSDGNELTRIPGGIDIQAYANILDLTLEKVAPVSDLVKSLALDRTTLSEKECRLLAYNSWGQNPNLTEELDEVELFRSIYDACPAGLQPEQSIAYMQYFGVLLDSLDTELVESTLNAQQIEEATDVVYGILGNYELVRANIFAVILDAANISSALTEKDTPERQKMVESFLAAINKLRADEAVYKRERIYTVLGKIRLEQIDDPEVELSEELQAEAISVVAWADESTPDPYQRQDIINASSGVLERAGLVKEAKALLLAELDTSKEPYYFMVSLGDIEQEAGNYEEAIAWFKKAYDVSTGPATRFQWGYYYVVSLMEMAPDDHARIKSATISVIRELEAGAGFYQRPKAQLARLEQKLLDWSEETEQADTITGIRSDVLVICDNFEGEEGSFETCQSFLDSA
jgi:thiol-disulfide isomerase/thioredoxin